LQENKKNENRKKDKKDAPVRRDPITSIRASPGDSGVVSGIIATGTMVIVPYNEIDSDWSEFIVEEVPTHCGSGKYLVKIPVGRYTNRGAVLSMPAEIAYRFAEIGLRAGTNRLLFDPQNNKEPKWFDSDFAGTDHSPVNSNRGNRQVPRQASGRHKGQPVPCYTPKNYSAQFVFKMLIPMLKIIPPHSEEMGVKLVGESTKHQAKSVNVRRVLYIPNQQEEE
jgi:hypothetical protein